VIAARRGPAESAFTLPELIGLTSTCDVVLDAADHELVLRDLAQASDPLTRNKLEILSKLGDAGSDRPAPATRPRIRLAYQLTPNKVLGGQRVEGIEFTVTGTDEVRPLSAGLVLTSIGYRGRPIRGLPFDEAAAVVPNDGGRVIDPASGEPVRGSYVAGWIKRGPTGFIGTNKSCAAQTVHNLVADYNDGLLPNPACKLSTLDKFVRGRQPDAIDAVGWRAIDAAEITRGGDDRPRDKFTTIADMLTAAETAPTPPMRLRLLAGLRR
jgi:ferredoxin--NADP+ reductase